MQIGGGRRDLHQHVAIGVRVPVPFLIQGGTHLMDVGDSGFEELLVLLYMVKM